MSGIQGAGTNFHTEEVKPDEPFQNENTIVVIYVIFVKFGEEFSAQLNKTGHMKWRLFQKCCYFAFCRTVALLYLGQVEPEVMLMFP